MSARGLFAVAAILSMALQPGHAAAQSTPQAAYGAALAAANAKTPLGGPTVAILGDSITYRNSDTTGTTIETWNYGYMTWLNILSMQRFNFPVTANAICANASGYNFGVNGDTLAQMAARVPALIACKPDLVIFNGGTNDLSAATPLDSMKATLVGQIVKPITKAGIPIFIIPITPRIGLTSAQRYTRQAFNDFARDLAIGRADVLASWGIATSRLIHVVDVDPYTADYATTDTRPITSPYGFTNDSTHPNPIMAYWMGYALNQYLSPLYPPHRTGIDQSTIYDAAANPGGQLLQDGVGNSAGGFVGTGGTKVAGGSPSITPTGSVATGWKATRTGASSSAATTMVLSKENPRTDTSGPYGYKSGERQCMTVTISGAGGASEIYQLVSIYAPTSSNTSAGDKLYGEVSYEVMSAPTNLSGVWMQLKTLGASGTVISANPANQYYTDQPHKGRLRTPVLTVPAGFSQVEVDLQVQMATTAGTGSATVCFSDAMVKKMVQ